MKKLKWIAAILLTMATAVKGQETADTADSFSSINLQSSIPAEPISLNASDMHEIRYLTDAQLASFLNDLAVTPQIRYRHLPRRDRVGTFYSLQHPEWPPFPANVNKNSVWKMQDFYLLNDADFDYNAAAASATRSVSAAATSSLQTMSLAVSSPPDPGDGGSGTNTYTPDGLTIPPPDYGTNLFLCQNSVVAGYLTGNASNTLADVYYEIQSCTNLAQPDWQSEGFIAGSELTNWTPLSVFQGQRANLFIRLRSWEDSFDIGIPDWWQFLYFGTNGIDPDASIAGDGYSNLEKFQLGVNPTNYYNPNGPPGFFGYVDATGSNVFIAWSPAPGPVINYSIQQGVFNTVTGLYVFSQASTVSSNTAFIEDIGAINNSNAGNNIYNLEAVYPGGNLSATDTWQVGWYGPPAPTNVYAYADTNATNVLLSWSPVSSVATNYLIERAILDPDSYEYIYSPIAAVSPATNAFTVTGPFTNADNWSDVYGVIAVYPGGVGSPTSVSPIHVGFTNGLAAPASFYGYADETGTNLVLAWTPAAGTPTGYILFAGNTNSFVSCAYIQLATVTGSTSSFMVTNGFNTLYQAYAIFAVYADGSLSQAAFWQSANGAPAPGNFAAYFDATGTNVWLSWSAPAGAITGYYLTRSDFLGDFFEYQASSSATSFEDTNAVNTGSFDPGLTYYTIQATYSQGGLSAAATAMIDTLPAPTGLAATLDATGQNVNLTWNAVPGAVSYVIQRGVLNPATGTYSYATIDTVGAGVTTFVDVGAITGVNSYNNRYQVEAFFAGGVNSGFVGSSVAESSAIPLANVYVSACLVRNGTGRWQVMFSGLPTNSAQTVQLTWSDYYYGEVNQQNLLTTSLTNGIYPIPDADVVNFPGDNLSVQLFGPNGEPGQIQQVGYLPDDAPYFVDGRQHIKQNLNFLIRGASLNQLFFWPLNAASFPDSGRFNQTSTNFEEFSFLSHGAPLGIVESLDIFQLDNLWPFKANYDLAAYLVDTSRTNQTGENGFPFGFTNYNFQPNFAANIPAPAILAQADPYWIIQPGVGRFLDTYGGSPSSAWGVSINSANTSAGLAASSYNLFGLPYLEGSIVGNTNSGAYTYQTLSPGGNITTLPGYVVWDYASWCPAPTLVLENYYFAPLIASSEANTGLSGLVIPGENDQPNVQPFPVPIEEDFNVTNQTPPLIVAIGQPMIIGGWAKYSIQDSSPTKYTYLGQYFETNAWLLDSDGNATTNSAGILSPYGEFFPLQAGLAQFTTMPDIDPPYQQGTNFVRIISLNVDANHDGTMDLSYQGPDFVSASRPFRFWANDNQDAGDDGGNFGIPGAEIPDGFTQMPVLPGVTYLNPGSGETYSYYASAWSVHGRRDLVDYFPVYLNIGSLFQSNALSAGISYTDTNYQFVLSQADGILRFAYTPLGTTNYMNFLLDTNMSGLLAYASLTTITPNGVALTNGFISAIATNNGGIILVEAATNTTQPLVLTIYHGTNQIAQTSLPLSITGVEQMFRSKTMMLNPTPGMVPDRLTDADVPNEPDTIAKNFVFMHGYNVLPNEARGVAADMFKRMYWSGSHAKFWAVTWEGADSKIGSVFTPNYHTNVVNAFATAPLLANFIASLTNSGPVVAAAHSLGNMLTLSAISDWNAPISQYFMMDAAVPIEAIDPASTNVPFMTFSTWAGYSNRLFAANWYQLFPTNDARSTLFWNNRLGNLGNVDIYNFYSSGEEVLRLTAGDPPLSTINLLATQLINRFSLISLWPDVPFGTYSWYWQEKGKGTCNEDDLIGSSHGGWKFNPFWEDSSGNTLSPTIMNDTTNTILQSRPMFDFNSTANNFLLTLDSELLGSVPDADASNYAATYRNRILSDAIPAMSLVIGANPVPAFAGDHNVDMMTLKNGWSLSRTDNEAGMWHHSDFVQMAYTFTHQLFETFVTTGNLK